MTSKDQAIGGSICIFCIASAILYSVALFWPALEAIRLWLVAVPVFIAFTAIWQLEHGLDGPWPQLHLQDR